MIIAITRNLQIIVFYIIITIFILQHSLSLHNKYGYNALTRDSPPYKGFIYLCCVCSLAK